jgi:hypothetical protein
MDETKKSASQATNSKKVRVPLTDEQKAAKQVEFNKRAMIGMIQQAEKACKVIRQLIDAGQTPPKELLGACSVLSQALAAQLGA